MLLSMCCHFRFSGITEDDLESVNTRLHHVQAVLLDLFSSETVLIGHSLESDLLALKVREYEQYRIKYKAAIDIQCKLNVQAVLLKLFNSETIFIGHSLASDLLALKVWEDIGAMSMHSHPSGKRMTPSQTKPVIDT